VRFLIFLLLGISLQASSQYDQGKKLYFSKGCNGCHGITASGTHQYPALAYRRKPFLSTKLKEYRAKKASTQLAQMMIPFALELTDAQIDALTTFLSEFNENKKSPSNSFNIRGDGGS
jgi:cytochrome c553